MITSLGLLNKKHLVKKTVWFGLKVHHFTTQLQLLAHKRWLRFSAKASAHPSVINQLVFLNDLLRYLLVSEKQNRYSSY